MNKAITLDSSTINIILSKLDQLQVEIHNLKAAVQDDQSWYWSESWQKMEREADSALANGDYVDFDNVQDLLNHLHTST